MAPQGRCRTLAVRISHSSLHFCMCAFDFYSVRFRAPCCLLLLLWAGARSTILQLSRGSQRFCPAPAHRARSTVDACRLGAMSTPGSSSDWGSWWPRGAWSWWSWWGGWPSGGQSPEWQGAWPSGGQSPEGKGGKGAWPSGGQSPEGQGGGSSGGQSSGLPAGSGGQTSGPPAGLGRQSHEPASYPVGPMLPEDDGYILKAPSRGRVGGGG